MNDADISNVSKLSEVAYHFGPFFFAVIFIFFILKFAATRLKEADQASQGLYKNLSIVAWAAMLALVGSSVYFWYLLNIEAKTETLISGVVSDFKEPEKMLSPKMYIREGNYNRDTREFDYEWIVKSSDLRAPEELKISIFPDKVNQKDYHIPFKLPVSQTHFGQFLRLKWDRVNGLIRDEHNQPVGAGLSDPDEDLSALFTNLLVNNALAYDASLRVALEDSRVVCREEKILSDACIKRVQRQLTATDSLDFVGYHEKRALVERLLALDDLTLGKVFAAADRLRKGDISVSNVGATKEGLFALAVSADGLLQKQSIQLAQKLDSRGYELFLKRQLVDTQAEQRSAAVSTILSSRNTQLLSELKLNHSNEKDETVRQNFAQAIVVLDSQSLEQRLNRISDDKVRAVLSDVFALQNAATRYRYGGKNPAEGFDAVNLIAYLLDKNQIQARHEKRTLTAADIDKTLKQLSKDDPRQAGDLVFYNYGVVMLYLWDDQVIGMTPSGISIEPLSKYGAPLRFSRFGHTITERDPCLIPPLDCAKANAMIRDYYNKEGEWAGVFQLATITDVTFESIGPDKVLARAKYVYEPVRNSYETRTGVDHRIFDFEKANNRWQITRMRGYLSGAPIPELTKTTAENKVKYFIENRSPFSGLVLVDQMIKTELKIVDQTSIEALVKYAYRPAPHFQDFVQAGERQQTFRIEFSNGDWNVVAIVAR